MVYHTDFSLVWGLLRLTPISYILLVYSNIHSYTMTVSLVQILVLDFTVCSKTDQYNIGAPLVGWKRWRGGEVGGLSDLKLSCSLNGEQKQPQ